MTDKRSTKRGAEMALVMRMAAHWQCEACQAEWLMDESKGPRQCPRCGSRRWNDGELAQADAYIKSLVIRHLNPYRRPLSVRQRAALMQRKAGKDKDETHSEL